MPWLRRCPGTWEATAAFVGRRVLAAFNIYEALMIAVTEKADAGGSESKPQADGLLGAEDPSAAEEDWWFASRMRPAPLTALLLRCKVGGFRNRATPLSLPDNIAYCFSASSCTNTYRQDKERGTGLGLLLRHLIVPCISVKPHHCRTL